jgi:Ribonuclease G/E
VTVRILATASPGEVRVAAVRDDTLLDFAIWRPGAPDGVGDIYRGRLTARVRAMAGAFVALNGDAGFLPDSEGAAAAFEGDIITVRVVRAAQGGKGPRLTARLPPGEAPDSSANGLLVRGPGGLLELAARYGDASVLIDDAGLAGRLRQRLGDRLHVVAEAFDEAIATQVEALANPEVDLPGGARLAIHPTPALVAIDVDSGNAIAHRGGKAASHIALNRTVIPALAQQIRLRNLSGAIVIDFAGLPMRRRASLSPSLAAALADDALKPRLLGFSALGLAEVVRTRVHPPLHELLAGPHAAGLAALRRIAEGAAAEPHRVPVLRASPLIIAALQADTEALPDLARRMGRPLTNRSDPTLHATEWIIENGDA